jgi:hypothetical protein
VEAHDEAELLLAVAGAGDGLVIILVRGAGALAAGASRLRLLLLLLLELWLEAKELRSSMAVWELRPPWPHALDVALSNVWAQLGPRWMEEEETEQGRVVGDASSA